MSGAQPAFLDWFQKKLGQPFPLTLAKPLENIAEDVYASRELDASTTPPMIPEFLEEPREYAMAGFWGRGVNTYAFYFIERRGPHDRFFRLQVGGAYGSWDDDAREVVEFLRGYERWRTRHEGALAGSRLVHNMGQSEGELIKTPGASPIAVRGVYFDPGEWWQALADAATAD